MKIAANPRLWPAALRVSRPASAAAYLVALCAAETLTAMVSPQAWLELHAFVLLALLLQAGLQDNRPQRGFLLALSVAPLIRLLSLSLPLRHFPFVAWYLVIGAPLFLAILLVARTGGLRANMLGLSLRGLPWQALIGLSGLLLGWVEYLILRPGPLVPALTWELVAIPALILLVFTGFLEELLFRGVLQHTATRYLGRAGIWYGAVLFAILHLGYRSALDLVFVFGAALFFSWMVHRTRSIVGVTLAHGLTNISLYLVFPLLLAQPALPSVITPSGEAPAVEAPVQAPPVLPPPELLAPYKENPNLLFKATPTPQLPTPTPLPSATPVAALPTEAPPAYPPLIGDTQGTGAPLAQEPTPAGEAETAPAAAAEAVPDPASPTPVVCGPPSGWAVTIVQPGDKLSLIARRYGVTVSALQTANCLENPNRIRAGQRLYVPYTLYTAPTAVRYPSPTPYVVYPTPWLPTLTPVVVILTPVVPTATPVIVIPTEVPADPPTPEPPPTEPPMPTPPPEDTPVPPPDTPVPEPDESPTEAP